MKLIYSFPNLTQDLLDEQMSILKQMFGFNELPKDYQEFLLKNNGGFVSPGIIDCGDSLQNFKQIRFDSTLLKQEGSSETVCPVLYSFSAVWLNDKMDQSKVEQWDLFELMASNRYLRSYFDVMPDQMISIANCNGRNTLDMVCISLDKQDYGCVYYYFNHVNGPSDFPGSVKQKQLAEVYKQYHIDQNSFISSSTPEGKQVHNAILKTNFVKVADNFNDFLEKCYSCVGSL
ncbi:SMI1/KNR4 family protein [Myroides sp. LJL116]